MTTQDEAEAGLAIAIGGQFKASLGRIENELASARQYRERLSQQIHPFTVSPSPITLTAGAGKLRQPTLHGPRSGFYWDVHRLTATGFTAGTVTVYLSHTGADLVASFTAAGVVTLGKAQLLILAGDTLAWDAAGITGTVSVGIAGVEIAAPLIGDYLI